MTDNKAVAEALIAEVHAIQAAWEKGNLAGLHQLAAVEAMVEWLEPRPFVVTDEEKGFWDYYAKARMQ